MNLLAEGLDDCFELLRRKSLEHGADCCLGGLKPSVSNEVLDRLGVGLEEGHDTLVALVRDERGDLIGIGDG